TQSLVAEKTDISANRASRNFDLMITLMMFEQSSSSLGLHVMTFDRNRSSLGLHAPFLNVQMTFEQRSSSLGHQWLMTFEQRSSSLGHQFSSIESSMSNDVCSHQFRPRSSWNDYLYNTVQTRNSKTTATKSVMFNKLDSHVGMRCLTPAELEVLTNESA
ncbi:hypothetical protein Tco_1296571, partial [Tanacetum coccineum]